MSKKKGSKKSSKKEAVVHKTPVPVSEKSIESKLSAPKAPDVVREENLELKAMQVGAKTVRAGAYRKQFGLK